MLIILLNNLTKLLKLYPDHIDKIATNYLGVEDTSRNIDQQIYCEDILKESITKN